MTSAAWQFRVLRDVFHGFSEEARILGSLVLWRALLLVVVNYIYADLEPGDMRSKIVTRAWLLSYVYGAAQMNSNYLAK